MSLHTEHARQGNAALFVSQSDLLPSGSLVICTRHRSHLLRSCLEGVRSLHHQPSEILIVDNTRGDSDTYQLALEFGAVYLTEPVAGLSRARNRGIAEAKSEIVVFLDDDAIPSADWLGLILQAFTDPSVAGVSGKVITPEMTSDARMMESERRLTQEEPLWFEIASFGGMGLGSNMGLRKTACDRRSFFDERLGRGGPFQIAEEHYALAYLVSRGHSIVYLPNAIVYHPTLVRAPITLEARNSVAYFLLLFREFPTQRVKLLRFLIRRLKKEPLSWARTSKEPGDLVSSSLSVKVKAAISGLRLYLNTPKVSDGRKI